ncbi:Crp/Fnr family transcriptional regulator [Paraburkholderia rhynchosiae]|uniref:CRP-like cAMP-activated global transcriptional regulator n=1 Tax=Paraburkholderia rhynchosiae TaxID=487049 RepID=A0A2N7WNP7_9BURK|nr:Crp/Fnr family transcriptional regulator [Paraburkholderia rhynchosiae]PMS31033.1 Crp/Fnr family transcriptional regulator [Paraburkholderia rhynchosiae]CAB3703212.1 CRP-like cAMP-activated global transcriptional regulator [Paraburkholderia rhynchosiae]
MTARIPSTQLATLLAGSAWFRSAPAALQTQLMEAGRVERLMAGDRLFTRGDCDDGIYCMLGGLVRIGAASSSGKEALLAVIEPVNWFGEIALFDNRPRTHDAYAERDAELFHVPRAALAALLESTPAYRHTFGLLLTQKLRLAFDAIEEAALLPAAQRVARRLLLMAGGYGEPGALRRVLNLPQEDLAMMLALSRQTINQVLKQFETQGALKLGYAEIEIVDERQLSEFAQLNSASD